MTYRLTYRLRRIAAAAIFALAGPCAALASFPDKPVKLVVPYTPGGSADQLSRMLAEGLSRDLGQPVVVENKPGANTMIAATQVARSAPDGYTLLLASNASMVLNPMLYQRIAYDAARDFRVLGIVAELPLVVVANNEVPAATLAEFVGYAKARPGKLNYASVGIGNPLQLATELLKSRTGMDVAHIPYNGSAPALTSLMGNDTQLMVDVVSTSLPLVRERKIKALAVTTSERLAVLPDVPTVAESGFPGFRAATWFGVAVPSAVPQAEAQRLREAVDKVLKDPAFRGRFEPLGLVIQAPRGQADIDAYVQEDRQRWGEVIKANAIKLD
ncbi:tripartite tricarboxylate transporter substrate binding protein [Achromobacter insolitus]|jgi:tripartite-type tricarboxylate transporter receptor subunit TctC|uniref:ABC transporter substrate-binding protein n=1 Tax=Achromobacter insolitus TaxID=217204 RepID=A0A6S7F839_9BURK|nr:MULTISPECIES: tripartite tricarboxylate transporter substrate binding protein [Achromobacter]GLK92666.1 MFS transporter [Achromobacter xylosoxidans]APX75421.1 ABC transporter substrate-binding protein [Achromobacter insolitus]AVG40359.1 tripartite tricarboxylate transporter substrate binding protein [Achromobacter insolitus]AXA70995.1 tripartite tricarboxylate transporter substrate binding protein [Achromobacter insolitus]MCP1402280.1 tripartite-type tricarboxylate transporter receptor subu